MWHDELEPPRPARRALATLPGQLSRSRRSAQILSRMSRDEQGALRCRRLAGTALLVPQGVAPAMAHRPARDRCAALAARVRGCLSAAEGVLPRASQDRARGPVRVSHHLGHYPHLLFELRTEMCGSWAWCAAVRSAGATRAIGWVRMRRMVFRCSCAHISGLREAMDVILGGSDASDRCTVAWYRRRSATLTSVPTKKPSTAGHRSEHE